MTTSTRPPREFTGRKMFLVTASAFAIIIAVNVTMAVKAVSTFPGLEVENSYVASQTFDVERKAQLSLGWTARVEASGGAFRLGLVDAKGHPADVAKLDVTVGRSTERTDDHRPALVFDGAEWTAPLELAPGLWQVWVEADSPDGTHFRQRLDLHVRG